MILKNSNIIQYKMYYIIPISILTYKYRNYCGYYLLKGYSYLEILYNKWYNLSCINPDYKLFINGNLINNINEDIEKYSKEYNTYEIEYLYKNRSYRIVGENLEQLLEYLNNINNILDCRNGEMTPKIYKWISAVDNEGNNYLELLKKYSGPIGDFYNNGGISCKIKNIYWLKEKKIIITDFRMDEYILDGTNSETIINLVK